MALILRPSGALSLGHRKLKVQVCTARSLARMTDVPDDRICYCAKSTFATSGAFCGGRGLQPESTPLQLLRFMASMYIESGL
jgi:hypothetical protein